MALPVSGPVAAPGLSVVSGLFGKLPTYGDFVRRGWSDETIDAVDAWLTAGVAAVRRTRDDAAFAKAMHAAPLWQGYVPAGLLGPLALLVAVAPSVDRAGRLFPLAAGVAGEGAWASGMETVLDTAVYDAVAGRSDADALVEAIASHAATIRDDPPPDVSVWWPGVPQGDPVVLSAVVDSDLLERLLCEDPA